MDRDVDVVIAGAGLAGLVCATRLIAGGASVRVLEASERAGGRTRGTTIRGRPFDLGGQWIGPGQDRIAALVRELGMSTLATPHDGIHLVDTPRGVHRYRGTIPWLGAKSLAQLGVAVARTYVRSYRPPEDRESVEAIVGALSPAARGVFDGAFRTVFGAEAGEVSLLWYLLYARAGGGFFKLVDVEGGAQERKIEGGAFTIAEKLADRLDVIAYSTPVRRVVVRDGVDVISDRARVRGKRAVIAVPLSKVPSIEFDPALPRTELAARFTMGATVKVHALYERAFWKGQGLSGQAVSGRGPISVLFDNTTDGQAALVGFIVGAHARGWSKRDDRRRAILDQLVRWLGAEARDPIELVDHDWAEDPWTGGCPVASPAPGVLGARAAMLREPCGRIHWAGTETATKNIGYLDGAVESGERAAREVLAAL